MKKITILLACMFALAYTTEAQIKYGLRGGVSSSQLTLDKAIEVTTADNPDTKLRMEAKRAKVGLHFGGMLQATIAGMYIQPELLIVSTGGEVEVTEIAEDGQKIGSTIADQRFMRLDIPVVAGWKVGPARFGLGPVASFNLSGNDELQKIIEERVGDGTAAEEKLTAASWAVQLDAGLNVLGILALDVKYEFGLSKLGSGVEIGDQNYNFTQRNNQLIFSVGYLF